MFRRVFWIGLLFWTVSTPLLGRQEPADAKEALLGFDPVILIEESKEVLGEESISVVRGGFWYLFANEANKRKFENAPERYEIQMGGRCARMGGTTPGQPDSYLVHDGRIYIFGSPNCRKLFAEHPERYLDRERSPTKTTAESRREGMALVDKALQFLGGASRIDSLRTLHQTGVSQIGGVQAKVHVWRAFPDRWKTLVEHPRYGTFGRLMTDSGAYSLGAGGARALSPDLGRSLEAEVLRDPLEILRARKRSDFLASRVEGDGSLQSVLTQIGEVESILEIDGQSGEIRRISYQGRGEEGEVGTVAKSFSDYRDVDGIRRPFRIEASFEGAPFVEESVLIDSIEVDPKLAADLFAASSGAGGRP